MVFQKAEISDILRCHQRDTDFLIELGEYSTDLLKLISGNKYRNIKKYVPIITGAWYYLNTSLSNLQTLGEEYTGTIRVTNSQELISQFMQIIWLVLYIGGDKLFDKFLGHLRKEVHLNQDLTSDAKQTFLRIIGFLKDNKHILIRLHQSLFYIFGIYHSISNRICGVNYVLLRQWMQDTRATKSFNFLGYVSLVYLVYLLKEKFMEQSVVEYSENVTINNEIDGKASGKAYVCILCMDNCKDISCTPCGHLFCWKCIQESLQHQPCCPMCREDIPKISRIIPLQNF